MRGDPWSPQEQESLREIVAQLEKLDESTGGWTTKVDARQTGFSLHVKFDKKVDIVASIAAAGVFENGSIKLMQIVSRVLGQLDVAKSIIEQLDAASADA